MNKLTAVDLFAGCGGLTEGFEASGAFETIACVEWEEMPCRNLARRLETRWGHRDAAREVVRFDIRRADELFRGFADPEYGASPGLDRLVAGRKVNVIIGGPPCQAYSVAGRIRDENGMRDDYRNYLFESYLKVVARYRPDFFLFENVTGMLSAMPDGTPIVDRIRAGFRGIGYRVLPDLRDAVFNLPDFGVPQNRRRVILLGVSRQAFPDACDRIVGDFYHSVMPGLRRERRTVRDAIGDLPKLIPSVQGGRVHYAAEPGARDVPNHVPRRHSLRDMELFRLLTEDIAEKRFEYVSIPKLKELYTRTTGKTSNIHKYYVLRGDSQSNTIPAHLYKDGFRHIHPDPAQCRTITAREAARLQTFPDDYEFLGSMTDQFKMIGNAVPPLFAGILAEALVRLYAKYADGGYLSLLGGAGGAGRAYSPPPRPVQLTLFEDAAPAARSRPGPDFRQDEQD